VLSVLQPNASGDPSGLTILGSAIFTLGIAFTLLVNVTVQATKELRRPSRWC